MIKFNLRDQRGQALVEFAIVLPILLMIIFGITEFGRVMYSQLAINNAAREGARFGAVNVFTDEQLKTVVSDSAFILDKQKVKDGTTYKYYLQDWTTITDTYTPGGLVEIKVVYPVQIVAPVPAAIISSDRYDPTAKTFNITAIVRMRVE